MKPFLVLAALLVVAPAFADTLPIVESARSPATAGGAVLACAAPGDLRAHHAQR